MSGTLRPIDLTAEGAVYALQFAGDTLRLTTAIAEQLTAAAAFLARALAQFPDDVLPNVRRSEAIARLEVAGKAIGAEMRRRPFN